MNIVSKTVSPEQIAADNAAATKETAVTEPAAAAVKTDAQAETAEDSGSEEQTQDEEKEVSAAEEADGEEEEGESESSKEDKSGKPNKGKNLSKRISKLVRDRNLAASERDALRVQIEQMRAKEAQPAEKKVEPKATATDEPQADKFDTHAEYVKALAKWTVKQAKDEDRKEETISQRQTEEKVLLKRWNEGLAEVGKKFSDYEEVKESISGAKISLAMQQIFFESENGAELCYHLAKNPKEWERINALTPQAAAREFGKFEASLPKATAKDPKKITNAPDPIRPVGSGKTQIAKKTIYDKDLTQAEYELLRGQKRVSDA